jgi:septum formation inhibitor-activating ATPase MinD
MQQRTIVATDEAAKKYMEDTPNKYVMAKGPTMVMLEAVKVKIHNLIAKLSKLTIVANFDIGLKFLEAICSHRQRLIFSLYLQSRLHVIHR